ncbi:Hypothetical predicted protein [Marmota monax]|uniref:Uncharacterized protein n=1 Tax=Marmota monax TaxID=9995 RepID=A0A5E4D8Z6_MARMO|nr:Hypothetical predicted protein [Marmota monax]
MQVSKPNVKKLPEAESGGHGDDMTNCTGTLVPFPSTLCGPLQGPAGSPEDLTFSPFLFSFSTSEDPRPPCGGRRWHRDWGPGRGGSGGCSGVFPAPHKKWKTSVPNGPSCSICPHTKRGLSYVYEGSCPTSLRARAGAWRGRWVYSPHLLCDPRPLMCEVGSQGPATNILLGLHLGGSITLAQGSSVFLRPFLPSPLLGPLGQCPAWPQRPPHPSIKTRGLALQSQGRGTVNPHTAQTPPLMMDQDRVSLALARDLATLRDRTTIALSSAHPTSCHLRGVLAPPPGHRAAVPIYQVSVGDDPCPQSRVYPRDAPPHTFLILPGNSSQNGIRGW